MRDRRGGFRREQGAIRLGILLGAVFLLAGGAGGFWFWRTRARVACPSGTVARAQESADGSRQWRCLLPTGARQGPAITLDANGRKRQLDHFSADKLEGDHRAWSEEGALIEEGQYRNGLRQGNWTFHDPKTHLETDSVYDAGKRIGRSITYFPNGQIQELASYKDDVLSGEYTSYFQNGQIEWTGTYLGGRKVGPWKHFDPSGKRLDPDNAPAEAAAPAAPPLDTLANKVLFAGRPLDWWQARLAKLVELKKSRPELGPLLTLTVERARMTGLIVAPTSSGFEVALPNAP